MQIKMVDAGDAAGLSRFHTENFHHFKQWIPQSEAAFHSIDAWKTRLTEWESETAVGRGVYFVALGDDGEAIVAICSLINILRGPFQTAHLAYAIAKAHEGKGLMRELCLHVIRYAFAELELQRVISNYLPTNQRSARMLTRLGFEREGFARKYLYINGQWEDHVLAARVNPVNVQPLFAGRY